jgi:hypothetical protein
MKLRFTSLLLAAATLTLGQSQPLAVDVYVNERDGSEQLLGPGSPLASDVFKKIGVRLNWHRGELPAGRVAFAIRTVEHAPVTATFGALAASRLTDAAAVEITVFQDRVQRFLDGHASIKGVAAGYVLAHELAHAMQGVARHSESGILKAHWSGEDFDQMLYHKLVFTAYDVELIQRGLALRLASRQSETPTKVPEALW